MKLAGYLLLTLLVSACSTLNTTKSEDENLFDITEARELGDQLYAEGKIESALPQYLTVLVEEPDDVDLLVKVAYIYESIGNESAAQNTVVQILKVKPDHAVANEWMGLYLLKKGHVKEAQTHLEKASGLGQNGWQIYNGLGLIDDLHGHYTQAREKYQLALGQTQQPKYRCKILNNMGYSYYLSGETDKALAYFDKALVNDLDSRQALSNKGLMLVRLGQETQAEFVFSRIMDKHEAYNNIGFLDMIFKKYDKAESYFKLAIHTSPTYYKEAHENLSLLRRNQAE